MIHISGATLFFIFCVIWYLNARDQAEAMRRQEAEQRAAEKYADEHGGWGPKGPSASYRRMTEAALGFSPEADAEQRRIDEWDRRNGGRP